MGVAHRESQHGSRVFLFGSETSLLASGLPQKLCNQLHEASSYEWILEAVDGLPTLWAAAVKVVPELQQSNVEGHLEALRTSLKTGVFSGALFPAPNVILIPLSIIVHLTQYSEYLRATLPGLADTDQLPSSFTDESETLGLSTGLLSAIAVSCSRSLAELHQHGAVAVGLGMLIGALVDAQELSAGQDGGSMTLSVDLSSQEPVLGLNNVLEQFPETYNSIILSDDESLLVTPKHTGQVLIEQLKAAGIRVRKTTQSGRLHWPGNHEVARAVVEICDRNPKLQFIGPKEMAMPVRLDSGGHYISNGTLHDIAVQHILLKKSEWPKTFGLLDLSLQAEINTSIIHFGKDHCIPYALAKKLGSRLIQITDVDLSAPKIQKAPSDGSEPILHNLPDDRIAVIGMACHVPGAEDLQEYWDIISRGLSQHREVPSDRFNMQTPFRESDPNRKWYGNFLQNYDAFDHKFFKKSPREMASTDPQHRLILKLAYQAVEQSGYFGVPDFDKHIGCYVGVGNNDYDRNISCYPANAYTATGNLKSFIAGKVSHYFGWTGPSLTVDSACSSSGVAVHQACRAILNGECTSALAGGVNVFTNPEWFHNLAGAYFLSPTGQCKPFDASSDGYCRGEGAGVVFLKKLSSAVSDGDQILGVIASTGAYQNQNCTTITAPSATSLAELFKDVVRQAKLEPSAISVVEAHGTGTPVGDPAEYDGVRRVLGGSIRSDTLSLTAVKGILGHTEFASGILSLLKVLLMVNEGYVPPQPGFNTINPLLNARAEDLIEIPKALKTWDVSFRAALVNNYGASGSNVSMVVTEAPNWPRRISPKSSVQITSAGNSFPFWLSGSDTQSLRSYSTKLRYFLQKNANSPKLLSLANLSFQLSRQSNRSLPQALVFKATSVADLEQKLISFENGDNSIAANPRPSARPVILCFGGQISSFIGLGQELYHRVGVLRSHLDHCDAMCQSLGFGSIYPWIFQKSAIDDITKLQTALFATQYSCAMAWIDSGVEVAAVVGHSFGELTALCIAGVYSLKDALGVIAGRATLIRDGWGPDKGAMLAVESDLADVEALISKANVNFQETGSVSIACYNGPRSFTLAGTTDIVNFTEDLAKSDPAFSGFRMKRLNVTHAFHSAAVDPLMGDLKTIGRGITFRQPTIAVERSTETGAFAKFDSEFLARHMRDPVYFDHAVHRLAKERPSAIWLEAGSNSTITTMASRALGKAASSHHFQSINITSEGSLSLLADATASLWKAGLNVTFWAHHSKQVSDYTPLLLPPYQFEQSRHWLDLKEVPQLEVPVTELVMPDETPKTLTVFLGNQDQSSSSARFRVNTAHEKFEIPTKAYNLADLGAVTPGSSQLEFVLDALSNLRPDYKDIGLQPEIRGILYHNILVHDASLILYIDITAKDHEGLTWDWVLHGTGTSGATTDYSSGTVMFRLANDHQLQDHYASLTRLSGRKQCLRLLQGNDADDVLQGPNIYRAFKQVINYQDPLRLVTKISGKDNETAGRVTAVQNEGPWINSILTESLFQVPSISINLMGHTSEPSETGIFICDKISQWLRSPTSSETRPLPEVWEVFAVQHQQSESRYVSDIFAFNPRDGSLVEVLLGASFQRMSFPTIRSILTGDVQSGVQSSFAGVTPDSTHISAIPSPKIVPLPIITPSAAPQERKIAPRVSKPPGPDVTTKTREMVCNLSGLEPEEIKDDSDLVELGIDSLMAMELVREVEAAFKCTLENDQLMELTDFNSLVLCIRSTLGLAAEEGPEERIEVVAKTSGTAPGISSVPGASITPNSTKLDRPNGAEEKMNANGNGSAWDPTTIRSVFEEIKWATDDSIIEGQLNNYSNDVIPRSTEICVAYIVDGFEKLGCSIRSASPGQQLERVQYLPKHERYMKLMYDLLERDARLIDIDGSTITRTSVPAPPRSVETLVQELLQAEPVHAAEHQLTAIVGPKFADLITGKEDGVQVIFGLPESKQIASDMYSKSPVNTAWIKQIGGFIQQLLENRPKNGEPIRIFEIGAGTGGTTSRMVPILHALGVPVIYTMTDISGSMIATARRRFKQYPFMEFKVHDIESEPDPKLLQSQHIILATNCVHATRNLSISLRNLHRILRPDGFLMLLEMTEQVPWVDFSFGLLEGWWLFEDGRDYVLQPATYWEKILQSVGYGHIDWTDGELPEAKLQRLIIAYASGPRYDHAPKPLSPPVASQMELPDTTERQAVMDTYVHKYTKDFEPEECSTMSGSSPTPKKCVIVTGATGSLGGHIVSYLAQCPEIHQVVCLNRLSSSEATLRQKQALEMRGINLDASSMAKLKVIETDTSKPLLGLSQATYRSLVDTATHIVHSAWPMSLTRPIRTYEIQFKIVRNLINLASEVTAHRPTPFKFGFQFISSSAVVANYPQWTGKPLVPEETMTIESIPAGGYAEAKAVSEQILAKTLYQYPDRFHVSAVRIAQISGSNSNGYWNPTEYMPFLIRSSQVLKILPDLNGTLSWYPVDAVAATLGDLLLSNKTEDLIYHIDNPSRQNWRDMMSTIAHGLGLGTGPDTLVPFREWVDRVRQFKGTTAQNPALQLIDFFDHYFLPMSCGGLVLDTTKSSRHSKTLTAQGPVSEDLILKYIDCWKQSGFLD
ncbi:uncharacterized protein JN550_004377 [Neoarthrinium moseri]|uniref:uncharacterized protein n=1 Tax=Neoarthrinium moseri TaxID=1658444 RepID=UPI001FDC639E|nr:uncharacterized protein JN550_004377 [Neoarthrinium moseri]KAI1871383.1 hypothetical protein JN550_004377 [Neoarthrinium moseri]